VADDPDWSLVLRQPFVRAEQNHPLNSRLRQEQTIEGVVGQRWKRFDAGSVLTRHREFEVAVAQQATAERARLDASRVPGRDRGLQPHRL